MNDSVELCKKVAETSPKAICSFSMGKDSIGAAIQMRRYFSGVDYVFLYMVPDLEFQEIALQYYEAKFSAKIKRMPNPSIYRQLNSLMYQHPGNVDAIFDANLYEGDYDEVFSASKIDLKLPESSFVGVGVRSADSMARRTSIKATGGINLKRKQFFPVHDWNMAKLVSEIKQSGIKLPVDYKIWGRTFDGFDHRFLKPLKDNFPRDFEKIMDFFPLINIELKRYEKFGK